MKIVKNDHTGKQVWEYEGECVAHTEHALLFEARFNRSDMHFNGVLLREGDRFLELYPLGKWFNIYEIHDRDSDAVKAWYCNVTRPVVIKDDMIAYDDLALDLFAYPDGTFRILDEDEFSQIVISEQDRVGALSGLRELEAVFSGDRKFSMDCYQDFI
jgi:predicted RNA-binding protein associated with RNAse of E/G family